MCGLVDRAIGLENLGFNSQWWVRGEVLGKFSFHLAIMGTWWN